MAKKLDMIKDIDGKRDTLKLAVRVVDHWYVQSRDSTLQLEMILMDENADKIHCIVRREEFDLWDSKLIEGETYIMHNFKVLKNEGQYMVCEHPYKLLFIGATSVKLQVIAKLPMKAYNFKSIKDIVSDNFIPDLLIVLLLFVVHCGMNIARSLYRGEWPVSVSNTWNGTKLIMESDFPQIVDFKKQMKLMDPDEVILSQCASQLTQSPQYTDTKRFVYKCLVKSLSEIPSMKKEVVCVTVATTVKFNLDNEGWYRLQVQKRMIEAGEDDSLCFPDALDVMLGCTFAFKVRTQPRTKCASVIKVSNVSEIVAHVKSLIPPLQIGDSTDKCSMDLVSESSSVMISELRGKSICNLAADTDTNIMSLSATGDNESDYVVIGTPGKRLLPCSENCNESSQDMDSAQLSSTKMKKLIKKEKT
ncbi:uncharacterized protein LOC114175433 [Vigna unguiculata]|uniref:uncharacterized protein LOC114175433 n=1 Tax=Vigna unguiculata TaxID=3917 RepID=UPI001015D30B|nr:uncharacterized protein LOC114175433 [Vigna unguiculata]